jgi:hypothetical protein
MCILRPSSARFGHLSVKVSNVSEAFFLLLLFVKLVSRLLCFEGREFKMGKRKDESQFLSKTFGHVLKFQ